MRIWEMCPLAYHNHPILNYFTIHTNEIARYTIEIRRWLQIILLKSYCIVGTMARITIQAVEINTNIRYTFMSSTLEPLQQPSTTGISADTTSPVYPDQPLLTGPSASSDFTTKFSIVLVDTQGERHLQQGHLHAPIPLLIGIVSYFTYMIILLYSYHMTYTPYSCINMV